MGRFYRLVCVLVLLAAGVLADPIVDDGAPNAGHVVKEWTTREGLPSNKVTALAQSKDGYLWVGTSGGLARFDGVRFKLFGGEQGLPQIPISQLRALPDGRVWVRNDMNECFWVKEGECEPGRNEIVEVAVGADGLIYVYDESFVEVWGGHWKVDREDSIAGSNRYCLCKYCRDSRRCDLASTGGQERDKNMGSPAGRVARVERL